MPNIIIVKDFYKQRGMIMPRKVEVNKKAVLLRDGEAAELVRRRAIRENRSASNALAQTVIEHLKNEGSQDEG